MIILGLIAKGFPIWMDYVKEDKRMKGVLKISSEGDVQMSIEE